MLSRGIKAQRVEMSQQNTPVGAERSEARSGHGLGEGPARECTFFHRSWSMTVCRSMCKEAWVERPMSPPRYFNTCKAGRTTTARPAAH